jgi:hypothetical protein
MRTMTSAQAATELFAELFAIAVFYGSSAAMLVYVATSVASRIS